MIVQQIFVLILCLSFLLTGANNAQAVTTSTIDKIEVYKSKRKLLLLSNGKVTRKYKVALGGSPVGHKQFEGDQKTPEGTYTIDGRNPNSSFHRSLHISYPNAKDREYAKKNKKSPGGELYIHGLGKFGFLGKGHTLRDWTLGWCIAVTNEEIEEIWKLVKNGTRIEIYS